MTIFNEKNGTVLIAIVCIAVLLAFFIVAPVAQDNKYHNFSDTAALSTLPNALNVFSNIPFFIVGIAGLIALTKHGANSLQIIQTSKLSYFILFLGSALVGVGSSYYHLSPSNETLVWDRLPMTIAFMGLYSVIISEFVSEKIGKACLLPFLFLGVASVLYWWFTENQGAGDLRYYAIVQFLPILTIPIMLIFFNAKFNRIGAYWLLLGSYVAAKIFETFDGQIHDSLGFISGHSIKHILPAIGLYLLLKAYKNRTPN